MRTTLVGGPLDGQEVEVSDDLPVAISVPIMNGHPIPVNPFLIPTESASFHTEIYRYAKFKPQGKSPEVRYVFSEIYKNLVR